MRPAVLLLLVGVTASACGGHAARPRDPAAAAEDPFAAVFRVVEQWRQGWEVRSFEALQPLYRQDNKTVVVYQGKASVGWPQAQTYLRRSVGGAGTVHLTLDQGQVTALGDDAATYAARMTREISDGAITATDSGFVTLTFARESGRWLIVAEHYSYPAVP
jgi:uncharacterized protein (TIGR02246 family)